MDEASSLLRMRSRCQARSILDLDQSLHIQQDGEGIAQDSDFYFPLDLTDHAQIAEGDDRAEKFLFLSVMDSFEFGFPAPGYAEARRLLKA